MTKWMVTLTFKEQPGAEVMALLPAERAHVAEMRTQGILDTIYVAADNSQVWLVLNGTSPDAVDEALNTLPMRRFFNIDARQLN